MISVAFLESRQTRFQLKKKDISTKLFGRYRLFGDFFAKKNILFFKESLVKTSSVNVEKSR